MVMGEVARQGERITLIEIVLHYHFGLLHSYAVSGDEKYIKCFQLLELCTNVTYIRDEFLFSRASCLPTSVVSPSSIRRFGKPV